jgi:hypothetical protein
MMPPNWMKLTFKELLGSAEQIGKVNLGPIFK